MDKQEAERIAKRERQYRKVSPYANWNSQAEAFPLPDGGWTVKNIDVGEG